MWLSLGLCIMTGDTGVTRPIFFELPIQFDGRLTLEKIGSYIEDGWIEEMELAIVRDNGVPGFYETSFRTTVCDDEVCEIMSVRLVWDLVGQYVGYDTLNGHPLTKFDHKPFGQEDYYKLHQLLLNDGSILKFKKKEELIDKQKVKASDVVDGTTGATAVEIKEEVVEGALYSSYTLWHLAYSGGIKNLLTAHTRDIFEEELKRNFLASGREGYRLFAFQHFSPMDYEHYESDWLQALREDVPLVRKLILRNLPETTWKKETVQNKVCSAFGEMDVNTRTTLLNKLKNSNYVMRSNLEILSGFLTTMNKNQTEDFLGFLDHTPSLSHLMRENLSIASSDPKFRFAYLVDEFLSVHSSSHQN